MENISLIVGDSSRVVRYRFLANGSSIDSLKIPYLASDFIEGPGDLEHVFERATSSEQADIAIGMCEAISVLNDRGVSHNDAAMRTFLVKRNSDGSISIVVTDFGYSTIDVRNGRVIEVRRYLSSNGLDERSASFVSFGLERVKGQQFPLGQSAPELVDDVIAVNKGNAPQERSALKSDTFTLAGEFWSQAMHGTVFGVSASRFNSRAQNYVEGQHADAWIAEIENSSMSDSLKAAFKSSLAKDPNQRSTAYEFAKALKNNREDFIKFLDSAKAKRLGPRPVSE